MVPTPQQIIITAKELHKFYRAATKAIGDTGWGTHDHGWQNCHKKAYFLRRAAALLVAVPVAHKSSRVTLFVSKGNISIR